MHSVGAASPRIYVLFGSRGLRISQDETELALILHTHEVEEYTRLYLIRVQMFGDY